MKYVLSVLAFLVSFAVSADPRISQFYNSSCHFPKDANNTGYEDKLNCPLSRLINDENGNVVAGYAIVKAKVPEAFVPPKIVVESDGQCLLKNDGNANTRVNGWKVKITGNCKRQQNGKLSCTATHELTCGNPDDGYVYAQ